MFTHYGGADVPKPDYSSFKERHDFATTRCGLWQYSMLFLKDLFAENPQRTDEVNKLFVCGYLEDFMHEYEEERKEKKIQEHVGEHTELKAIAVYAKCFKGEFKVELGASIYIISEDHVELARKHGFREIQPLMFSPEDTRELYLTEDPLKTPLCDRRFQEDHESLLLFETEIELEDDETKSNLYHIIEKLRHKIENDNHQFVQLRGSKLMNYITLYRRHASISHKVFLGLALY
jgi:hypothetical protein